MPTTSRQVNFYAIENEIFEVENYLRHLNYLVMALPIYNNNVVSYPSIREAVESRPVWPFSYEITSQSFLKDIKLDFIEKQNYFLVDSLRSPVIDFTLSFLSEDRRTLRRGRLYFKLGFYGQDQSWQQKNSDFIEWADDFVGHFRKALSFKVDKFDNLLSKGAYQLSKDKTVEFKQ